MMHLHDSRLFLVNVIAHNFIIVIPSSVTVIVSSSENLFVDRYAGKCWVNRLVQLVSCRTED